MITTRKLLAPRAFRLCFFVAVVSVVHGHGLAAQNPPNDSPRMGFGEMRSLLRSAALGEEPGFTKAKEALQQHWDETIAYQKERQKTSMKYWQEVRNEEWPKYLLTEKKESSNNDESAPPQGENKEFDAWMYQESGYDPDKDLKREITHSRTAIANHLVRFHIEEGDVAAAVEVQERNQRDEGPEEYDLKNVAENVLQADFLFAVGEFEKSLALYQENVELTQIGDPFYHHKFDRQPFMDDVLFSKMGLACIQLERIQQAKRYFECAAELQETQGLYLESIISAWRIHTLCGQTQHDPKQLCSTLPLTFAQLYPTVTGIICGNAEGSPSEGSDVLASALIATVKGDYVEARKLFVQASKLNQAADVGTTNSGVIETKALRALFLRERYLAELANVHKDGSQNEDPFFMLKKQVLFFKSSDPTMSRLLRMSRKERERDLTSFDAVSILPLFLHPRCQDEDSEEDEFDAYDEKGPISAMEAICARLESSTLRAVGYLQLANYVKVLAGSKKPDQAIRTATSSKPSAESVNVLLQDDEVDSVRQQRQRMVSLTFIEKALHEPGISPLVKIQAVVEYASIERAISKHKKVQRSKDGVQVMSWQATDEFGVPATIQEPTAFETKEGDVLSQSWDELKAMGQLESLTALDIGRRMKQEAEFGGSRERLVLAALFGNTSKPVLARRQDEAREDLRYGSGERAEELYTALLSDENERKNNPWLLDELISAKKKQGKYAEAIKLFEELKKGKDFQKYPDHKAFYLLKLAELHKLNHDLESASVAFQEVATLKDDRWPLQGTRMRAYGYIGLGDIALERGDLKNAQEEFEKGVDLTQAEVDAVFSKDYTDDDIMGADEEMMKSNAMADIFFCLYETGEVYLKHGYLQEALGFFEKCKISCENEWINGALMKTILPKIEQTQEMLADDKWTEED